MSAAPILAHLADAVLGLFPWLGKVAIVGGALRLGSATGRLQLVGPGPAVARVGDVGAIRFYRDTVTGTLYVSTSTAAPYSWAAIGGGIIPPTPTDPGTLAEPPITSGSGSVVCE